MRSTALLLACILATATGPLRADTDEKLLAAGTNPADWLTYGHGYANQRYAGLTQIHRGNVARLVPKWIYQTGVDGTFQTNPIVADGTVYLTTPRNHIVALDGATGEVRWKYTHKMATDTLCCGTHNRGLAIGYGRLYEITADGRLIAVDRDNGKLVWDVPVVDPASGAPDAPQQVRDMASLPKAETAKWSRFAGNMAPLVYGGLVIVGTTGAGYTNVFADDDEKAQNAFGRAGPRSGMRAFISAYAADTGQLVWRWYSTKDQGWEGQFVSHTALGDPLDRDLATERANAEKYRDAWKRGGGSISSSPALDPALGLLYFGTGNAAPYADLYRPGDNLYTASLIALDVKTGALRWYHQVTPHDIWGYDLAASPMLIDVPTPAGKVPGVALVTKSGWMMFFNRATGEVIRRSEGFVPQTKLFKRARDAAGIIAVPGEAGGANWPPIAYSGETGWAYVGGSHYPSRFTLETDAQGNPVNVLSFPKNVETYGTLSAIDPATGKLAWQQRTARPFPGGVTTTAGGLVFMGEADGHFTARDTRTGKLLWRFQTGAGVNAPPVVYERDGKQYVVVAAGGNKLFDIPPGNAVIGFGLAEGGRE
ncbi:MAG: PQQ-binding-like beta-propeller repeat protein [Dechloromonas sp.]|nr:PQQ-binding-like beta-propeller repeat protein [Dechloromonas sp.]